MTNHQTPILRRVAGALCTQSRSASDGPSPDLGEARPPIQFGLGQKAGLLKEASVSRQRPRHCAGESRMVRTGYTLLDLAISVLIIGIIAAVAVPRFVDALHEHRAAAAADTIRVDLELARKLAMTRSTTQTVQFLPDSNEYTLIGIEHIHNSSQTYTVRLADPPYSVSLVSASLGGDSDVTFDQFGRPDSDGTITVQAGGFQQTVTINADTGKATIP